MASKTATRSIRMSCVGAFLFYNQNSINVCQSSKGPRNLSRCLDYGYGAIRCEQKNTMRGWGRDCFPLSDRHTSLHSECLAQATSQEAPQTFVSPFHPSLPKKLKLKKSIFEHNSVAAKFGFLYQEADFFAKI